MALLNCCADIFNVSLLFLKSVLPEVISPLFDMYLSTYEVLINPKESPLVDKVALF